MTARPRLGDDALVRTAARQLAVRAALLVALAMLALVVLVTAVLVRGQSAAADNLLRTTAASANDVVDPPPGTWLILARNNGTTSSPGLPVAVASRLGALRVQATTTTQLVDLTLADQRDFRVATLLEPNGSTVQVVLDLHSQHAERRRVVTAMAGAGLLGLVLAAGLGAVLGRRAVRPLANALRLQRAFVADASHELRTPLTLLSTRAQLLDSTLATHAVPDHVRRDSAGVVADVHRLGEVLEDLLLAADPRQEAAFERVDLAALATAVVESAAPHGAEQGVALSCSTAQDCFVLGAPAALRRAVLALLDNAIDHTPREGRVTVTVAHARHLVVVTVTDTGPGIAPEAAVAVMQRFHSGGQRSGRAHYGLGLALTHDVANRYGGGLRLVPSPVGASFELRLPGAD